MAKSKRSGKKRAPNKYIVFVMKWKKDNADYVKKHGHIMATKEAAKHYRQEHGLTKSPKKSRRKSSRKRKSSKKR